ncbi:hypothetical protein ACF0H5_021860 [Mactra antiquata]
MVDNRRSSFNVINDCDADKDNGWTVGIMLPSFSRQDARIYFSFFAEGSSSPTVLLAHRPYDVDTWTNVAVTYDGLQMALYVNGAGVTKNIDNSTGAFRSESRACAGMYIGGRKSIDSFYRGKVDEFKFWKKALGQTDIVSNMNDVIEVYDLNEDQVVFDPFDDLLNWEIVSTSAPTLVDSGFTFPFHTVRLEAPPCGKSVCDDPEVVLNYLNNTQLRRTKKVRYRVINIYDDNGKNPILSDLRIAEQHKHLLQAFQPYNIDLDIDRYQVMNTTLSRKVFMFDCNVYQIGNGICDPICAHSTTGNDGGDCDLVRSECRKELLGNGQCNNECNKAYHNYDNGDCCKPASKISHKTCIDPENPHRGYMNIDELKMLLQIDGSNTINVYLLTSSWNREAFHGMATYPWEKNVYTSMGGIVMHVDIIGQTDKLKNLVHEFGHVFGLWHVHRGISEMSCEDPCRETQPSMTLGDMCSDTLPTPRNSLCMDPVTNDNQESCDNTRFYDTPFTNYMSYADDSCINHFTPQQEARMHCYLDLVYQPMREMKQPAPIPVPPKILQTDDTSISMVWLSPLGTENGCHSDNSYHQYATIATASHSGERWAPHQATGFPDAEKCSPSRHAWKPFHSNMHPGCDFDACWIMFEFKVPVVADRLSIWVVDIREDTSIFIELITDTNDVKPLGDIPVYCDVETTVTIDTTLVVEKVKLYTEDSYIAIDAVELVSKPDYPTCVDQKLLKYKVTRDPAFDEGYVVVGENKYTDRTVVKDVTYTYKIQTIKDSRTSEVSPSLVYTHGSPYCGDGTIQSNEECDDGNVVDGDGCNLNCKIQDEFTCMGTPSLCMYSLYNECNNDKSECDLTAPNGFYDQWTTHATANPEYQEPGCPTSLLVGPRDTIQKCETLPTDNYWRPCGELLDVSGDFWIDVYVYKPVVATEIIIHLASDGRSLKNPDMKHLHIQLIDIDDKYVDLHTSSLTISCEDNPIHVPVIQDLSKPFVLTKGVRISFTSSSIGLYAVRVRASPYINPIMMKTCKENELYSTKHGICVVDKCTRSMCSEFPVKYGVAVCTGNEDGDSCKVECDNGYFLEGHENKAVCVDGSWVSASPLICSPVDCGKPYVSMATVVCSDGMTYGKTCNFKCDKPSIVKGDDTTITCQKNGKWSNPKAICVVQCKPLDDVAYDNGKLKTTSCIKGPQPVGQQCKVRCQEGYHAQGGRTRRRFLRIVCDDSGEWFGPKCVPNTCPSLPRMFLGAYTCTDDFNSNSVCTMNCPDDLSKYQSVKCTRNGVWDSKWDICFSDSKATCPVLASDDIFQFKCDHSNPGGECTVTCTSKDHIPIQKLVKSWSAVVDKEFEYINTIVCTVLQKWEPDISSLECVQQCAENSIEDGFCDAKNNRDVCDWDGGDCCPSTVQWGKVLPIPEDCGDECSCKDPLAIENRRRRKRHRHGYWVNK